MRQYMHQHRLQQLPSPNRSSSAGHKSGVRDRTVRFIPKPTLDEYRDTRTSKSETHLPRRIPGNLKCGCSYRLLIRQIGRRQISLITEVPIDLQIMPDPLYHLRAEVIDSRATRDEILRRLLPAPARLHPLITAQMISHPGLPALRLASHPVAEDLPLIGVALLLLAFVIGELPMQAARGRLVIHRRLHGQFTYYEGEQ